jgi:hypothetical protein
VSAQKPTSHSGGWHSKSSGKSAETVVILIKRHFQVGKKWTRQDTIFHALAEEKRWFNRRVHVIKQYTMYEKWVAILRNR